MNIYRRQGSRRHERGKGYKALDGLLLSEMRAICPRSQSEDGRCPLVQRGRILWRFKHNIPCIRADDN